jgi:hypothetical protein
MLNTGGAALVGKAMSDWHPAILGEMLKAVAVAKTARYPGHHPDYDEGLAAAQRASKVR